MVTISPSDAAADSAWGGSLVATTDYVFRGVSQTHNATALQGDLHYRSPAGWFAGLWASNINPGDDYTGSVELNAYAGWTWALASDWRARLSYVRYLYPDATPGYNYDYDELAASVAFQDRVFATIAWSPNMVRSTSAGLDRRGNAESYELSFRQRIWRDLALAGGVGYYDLTNLFGSGYWSWSAALVYPIGGVEFNLSRFGTDSNARRLFGDQTADNRWVLTAIWRF